MRILADWSKTGKKCSERVSERFKTLRIQKNLKKITFGGLGSGFIGLALVFGSGQWVSRPGQCWAVVWKVSETVFEVWTVVFKVWAVVS